MGLMCTVLTKLIFRVVFMQARRTYYLRVTITRLSGVSETVARLEDEIKSRRMHHVALVRGA